MLASEQCEFAYLSTLAQQPNARTFKLTYFQLGMLFYPDITSTRPNARIFMYFQTHSTISNLTTSHFVFDKLVAFQMRANEREKRKRSEIEGMEREEISLCLHFPPLSPFHLSISISSFSLHFLIFSPFLRSPAARLTQVVTA